MCQAGFDRRARQNETGTPLTLLIRYSRLGTGGGGPLNLHTHTHSPHAPASLVVRHLIHLAAVRICSSLPWLLKLGWAWARGPCTWWTRSQKGVFPPLLSHLRHLSSVLSTGDHPLAYSWYAGLGPVTHQTDQYGPVFRSICTFHCPLSCYFVPYPHDSDLFSLHCLYDFPHLWLPGRFTLVMPFSTQFPVSFQDEPYRLVVSHNS